MQWKRGRGTGELFRVSEGRADDQRRSTEQERKPESKSASHGEAVYERAANDFYPTNHGSRGTAANGLEFDNRGPPVGAGMRRGGCAKELDRWHAAVVASDIAEYGYGETGRALIDPAPSKWPRRPAGRRDRRDRQQPPFDQVPSPSSHAR